MKEMERFNSWQQIGLGVACWFVYAWLVWPLWAEYQLLETRVAVFVAHAVVGVGVLIWRGWTSRPPVPVEEDSEAPDAA
jgi:type VI protein secretion system component VasK